MLKKGKKKGSGEEKGGRKRGQVCSVENISNS
jgi:hypothetical protein